MDGIIRIIGAQSGFFDSSSFMPHGHCYLWKPGLVWLHAGSDLLIGFAYLAISLILYQLVRKHRLPFSPMIMAFGAFIGFCGLTHFFALWNLWNSDYWSSGFIKLITAAASVATGFFLIPTRPKISELVHSQELSEARRQELERVNKELEEKYEELEVANERVRREKAKQDQLFANVSHELRTPLTLIMAPVESMLEKRKGQLSESDEEALKTVHNNSVRLLQMINAILDFSKMEAREIEVKREAVDLVEVTRAILVDFQPLIMQKGLESQLHIESSTLIVEMDRYIYERILFNLLSNAIKFTPTGGKINVDLNAGENECVTLSVRDTGIGIAASDVPRLFDKFSQVDSSPEKKIEGTGLGLTMVKEFARLLDGSVQVESQPGKGSRFDVRLKAPQAQVTEVKAQQGSYSASLLPRFGEEGDDQSFAVEGQNRLGSVLIAEDNVALSSYIADILSEDCEVRRAYNGAEALRLVEIWKPDLVVSDIMMPMLDGIELCRRVKSSSAQSSTSVILLTAMANRDAMIRGWEAGADEYLYKPFHPRELKARVHAILRLKQAQNEKERLLAARANELEVKVAHRTEALLKANEDLQKERDRAERANQAKDQFLANMSHELRTPLGAILGYADLMSDLQMSSSDIMNNVYTIRRNGEHLLSIVDDILDLSLVETGKLRIEKSFFELGPFLSDIRSILESKVREKDLSLSLDVKSPIPQKIKTDPVRLREILFNIGGNAIKFTEEGNVTLALDFKFAEHPVGRLRVEVADTGVGIDPDDVAHLFQPFHQVDSSMTRKYGGTGIGLVLSRKLTEALGGSLQLAWSRPGQGSRFVIDIPVEADTEAGQIRSEQELLRFYPPHNRHDLELKKSKALAGMKILIAEDNNDILRVLRNYLESVGAQCDVAQDGLKAVEKALNNDFDVILMDVQMPHLDGLEALRRLRRREYRKPIIAVTAHAMKEEAEKYLSYGYDGYVSKPIHWQRLMDQIQKSIKAT